jgi:putative membrane protein
MNTYYKKIFYAVALVSCLCFFNSCKDDDDDYAMNNQEFVTRASSSNNFEVAAGALAVSKGQNAEVKHYGEHMVAEHTAVGVEMKNLASRKGWNVPNDLQPKEQANLTKLMALDGAAFDKQFATIMVQSHQDAISLFETAAADRGVRDNDLRAMAGSKLPNLRAHLQQAVQLNAMINP